MSTSTAKIRYYAVKSKKNIRNFSHLIIYYKFILSVFLSKILNVNLTYNNVLFMALLIRIFGNKN